MWAFGECAEQTRNSRGISEDDFRIVRDDLAEEIAARAISLFHIACSLTLLLPMSGSAKAKQNAKASSHASRGCHLILYSGRRPPTRGKDS